MREQLQRQLASLVAQHADWLTADAWKEACELIGAGYFEQPDELATFRTALQERMREP